MSQLIVSTAQAAGQAVASAASGAAAAVAQGVASGAASAASAYAVAQAEALIFGPVRRTSTGPRIDAFHLQTASEGTPVPVVYGRARLAGEILWASAFRETIATDTTTTGGKGGGGRGVETTSTTYLYSVSLAIGLCEGEIARIGRVWADGKPVSLQDYTTRLHTGTEDQLPDSVIEAVEGAGLAPAYRGLAYIVFEDLPLAAFGNRIPHFSFEIERPLVAPGEDTLENAIRGVCLIPGSGEAAYGTTPVLTLTAEGVTTPQNVNNNAGGTDFVASVRALAETLPACSAVALVVSWFGTDLRAGFCAVRPGVELAEKETLPENWSVGGVAREAAHLVSQLDGRPAYGGTPSDRSVVEAIVHLKQAGFEVMFYPFILMDIPPGNTLTNDLPDGVDETGQPAYPWRGRIGVGGDDKTPAARAHLDALFGSAMPGDFTVDLTGASIAYSGAGDDWGLRRMVLHYAHLCALAGGVSAFLIGSEMRGITRARDGAGAFPAVEAFTALAGAVRSVLGSGTAISYAADWTEYAAYHPQDGSGDVLFPLDDLWADEAIDFIGIDNYMPLADWRDGTGHRDAQAGYGPYDIDYLQANIKGGEGYDWYYASQPDRDAQHRTPIEDSAHGEGWVFRIKDLWHWWGEMHHPRPGGVRAPAPTPWQPRSKPIRFTELGCAAIDKAANQPNVFYDPKSSESLVPYYSTGGRDDFIQRRFIEAHLSFWADAANNPLSDVYDGSMVDTGGIYLYAWDARPFPDFPARDAVWSDAPNWSFGHWLNGRAGRVPLDRLVADIAGRTGLDTPMLDTTRLQGLVTGYVIDRPMSPRAALEPLAGLYQFDAVETAGTLRFVPRGAAPLCTIEPADLVVTADGAPYELTMAQAGDLPGALEIGFIDEGRDFALAVASARQPFSLSKRTVSLDVPVVMDTGEAEGRVRCLMADALVMARQAGFVLAPSLLALEPADVVTLALPDGAITLRLADVLEGDGRAVSAVATAPSAYALSHGAARRSVPGAPSVYGPPVVELLDLPLLASTASEGALSGSGTTPALYAGAFASPWPGGVSIYRAQEGGDPVLEGVLERPARLGRLVSDLAPGPVSVWDRASRVSVRLSGAALSSMPLANVLSGANMLAVESATGEYEILRFADAALQPDGSWHLTTLLRGLAGTEGEALAGASAGARVMLLDGAVQRAGLSLEAIGLPVTYIAAPRGQGNGQGTGQGPDSANAVTISTVPRGLGWRPLSPVHLRAEPHGGDLQLTWIRRTRLGGDNWAVEEVPLGEETEIYDIDIFDGTSLKRALTSPVPAVTYTAEMIAEDFPEADPEAGPGGSTARIAVSQRSALTGRGRAVWTEVDIPPPG